MLKSILGTKVGMTQVFDKAGNLIPVTVVSCEPCVITSIRTKENDGYTGVQLAYGTVKEKNVTKPQLGQYKKANASPRRFMREFRVADVAAFQLGQEVKVDIFKAGDYVDVSGVTKGRGFSGTVKRHNFRGGPTTHGQSDRTRAPGAIGAQGFQRVIKGLRMAGHYGVENVTIQRLEIIGVDAEKNLMLIHGALPGTKKGLVVIEKTLKKVSAKPASSGKDAKKKSAPAKGKK